MLTGNLVRVKFNRNKIVPRYVDPADGDLLAVAEQLLDLFRRPSEVTRGDIEGELNEQFSDDPMQLVGRGLAKLLEDRCDFAVVADRPPEQLRELVFRKADEHRRIADSFDRDAVLREVATELGVPADEVENGLFADLRSEQRRMKFDDISPERLLHRYNLALAQAVVLRASAVDLLVKHETPARLRALVRRIKFHRLICEAGKPSPDVFRFRLDGPMSLFTSTQKYGLQLALFLPAVLACADFELTAELLWGPERKPKQFVLTPDDGLQWHQPGDAAFTPPEVGVFAAQFVKRCPDWDIDDAPEVRPLGDGFWVPDFRLTHRPSKKSILLEILGFWRRSNIDKHLKKLKDHVREPFLVAVSDQLHVADDESELPPGVVRFRQMPLPDEIAKRATEALRIS